jgi:uncharacterized protein
MRLTEWAETNKHPIPESATSKHIAILGKTGSGKTFAAKGIVEGIARGGGMVVILDPTGAWWGLGLTADGKSSSDIRTIVIGGQHGHMPLDPHSGKACADLVAHREGRQDLGVVIFDVGTLTVGERTRWAYEFGERLYQLNARPLHLIIDEAHCFAPQGRVPDPESGRMVHAFCQLASGGRSRGIRLLMITQRPAKLHKDALTCADTLVAMRVLAIQDRGAVEDWIDGAGDRRASKEVVDSLARLKTGEGWVWFPDGDFLERVMFPRISTYDSSATPDDTTSRPKLPPADMESIRGLLGEAAEKIAAEDPAKLRARIKDLEKQLDDSRRAPVADSPAIDKLIAAAKRDLEEHCEALVSDHEATVFEHNITAELVKKYLAGLVKMTEKIAENITCACEALTETFDIPNTLAPPQPSVAGGQSYAEPPVRAENGSLVSVRARASGSTPRAAASASADRGGRTDTPAPMAGERDSLSRPQLKVIDGIAWWMSAGVKTPTRVQVAHIAGYTPTSGTYRNILAECRSAGLIEYQGECLQLTLLGSSCCLTYLRPHKYADMRDEVLGTLSGPQQRVLKVLFQAEGAPVARTTLAETAGYEPKSGTYRNILSELVSLRLARYPNRTSIAAEAWLFGGKP